MMRRAIVAFSLLLALAGCHGPNPARQAALAAAGQIDTSAPLQTTQQITINAPPARVWQVLSNISAWPGWAPAITATNVGREDVGDNFYWTTGGMTINSVIQAMTPDQMLSWTGHVLNFHAIHVWVLSPQPDGGTIVTVRESVSGFMIGYFYSNAQLQHDDANWLSALKKAAETS